MSEEGAILLPTPERSTVSSPWLCIKTFWLPFRLGVTPELAHLRSDVQLLQKIRVDLAELTGVHNNNMVGRCWQMAAPLLSTPASPEVIQSRLGTLVQYSKCKTWRLLNQHFEKLIKCQVSF